jgi:hypothetical protein
VAGLPAHALTGVPASDRARHHPTVARIAASKGVGRESSTNGAVNWKLISASSRVSRCTRPSVRSAPAGIDLPDEVLVVGDPAALFEYHLATLAADLGLSA